MLQCTTFENKKQTKYFDSYIMIWMPLRGLNGDKCLIFKGEVCKSSISYGKFRFFAPQQSNLPNGLQNMKKAIPKGVAFNLGGPGRT